MKPETRNWPAQLAKTGFVEAVRLLARERGGSRTLGTTERPDREPLRLAASTALSFASADLLRLEQQGEVPRLVVRFLALAGSSGVLPASFAERLARYEDGDNRAADFVDLLHHRLLALAFRAALKHAPWLGDHGDFWSHAATLLGIGCDELAGLRPHIARRAGLLALRVRSAKALEQCLRSYFALPYCVVRPLLAQAQPIALARRSRLGRTSHRLGHGAVVGRRRRDPRRGIAISIGPVDAPTAAGLAPGGERHAELCLIVDRFARDNWRAAVTIAIAGTEIPVARLDRQHRLGRRGRLGGRAAPSYGLRFALEPGIPPQP